jgi:hypothetical protein
VALGRGRGPLHARRGLQPDRAWAFAELETDFPGESTLSPGGCPATSRGEGCLQVGAGLLAAKGIGRASPQSAAGASQADHHDQPKGKPHSRKLDPGSPVAKGAQLVSP